MIEFLGGLFFGGILGVLFWEVAKILYEAIICDISARAIEKKLNYKQNGLPSAPKFKQPRLARFGGFKAKRKSD